MDGRPRRWCGWYPRRVGRLHEARYEAGAGGPAAQRAAHTSASPRAGAHRHQPLPDRFTPVWGRAPGCKLGFVRRALSGTVLVLLVGMGALAIAAGDAAKIKAGEFTVGAFSGAEGYAKCGKGKRALGGGVVQSGAPASVVYASGPLDASGVTLNTETGDAARQWYAAMVNETTSERTFRVYAICSADSKATIKATQFAVDDYGDAEGYARCGKGKRALGGGVAQSGPPSVWVRASGPLDASGDALNTETGDAAKQWYAAVRNGSGLPQVVRVFAICSADSNATIRSALVIADHHEIGEGYASCGGRKRALGGGVVPIGSASNVHVRASGPLDASGVTLNTDTGDTATQWYAAVFNHSGFQRVFGVYAICE